MCGIVGFIDPSGSLSSEWMAIAQRMSCTVRHRGPDDEGVWIDSAAGLALAHRRLSILDLSSAGHQPMLSSSGRFVIVFNGEIYNHLGLRRQLDSAWRGHSDTETLLAGVEQWGIRKTLESATGMFAFALWDRERRTLSLARDRLGEKPLYYGWQGRTFLFGSELRALKAHPAFRGEIDRGALSLLLRHNYIPAPHSIYCDIRKLPPGTFLQLAAGPGNVEPQEVPEAQTYWSAWRVIEEGLAHQFRGEPRDAIDTLESLLGRSVQRQMLADVPLGAFLSGGVDSSTVVALMQAQSAQPIRTFSIGFHEDGYDEAGYAKAVAAHLGTEHTDLYVTPREAMEVIPKLPQLYDEPFADSSQIPTYLVSQLARRSVTVSLSGDGGDELFCGYDRYFHAANISKVTSRLPRPVRAAIVRAVRAVPVGAWNRVLSPARSALQPKFRGANLGDKLHKLADVLDSDADRFYQRLVSHWRDPADVVINGQEPLTRLTEAHAFPGADFVETLMAKDLVSYLPDDILAKVDRAAMAVSLETRVPLLDPEVVTFAWQLPMSLKIRNGQGKWALRQVLYRHVPRELIERPKVGFGVPIGPWLRGPLQDWAENLLDESRLRQQGFFNPAPIRQKWNEHISCTRNWAPQLWIPLMFQAWLDAWERA
jgi:asparagine synthase (glutamine-hydrolysing)